jgi:hypothetical protein
MAEGNLSLAALLAESGELSLLDSLEKANITTVDHVLAELNAPESTIPRKILNALEHCIIHRLAAPGISAHDELDSFTNKGFGNLSTLQTGIKPLDDIFKNSSLSTHTLAEISGLPGSGKTVSSILIHTESVYQNYPGSCASHRLVPPHLASPGHCSLD